MFHFDVSRASKTRRNAVLSGLLAVLLVSLCFAIVFSGHGDRFAFAADAPAEEETVVEAVEDEDGEAAIPEAEAEPAETPEEEAPAEEASEEEAPAEEASEEEAPAEETPEETGERHG